MKAMARPNIFRKAGVFSVYLFAVLVGAPVYAATITVNDTDQDCQLGAGYAADGLCSLCEAIRAAKRRPVPR